MIGAFWTGLGLGLALGLAVALLVSLAALRALWKRTQAPNDLPPPSEQRGDVADFSAFGGQRRT